MENYRNTIGKENQMDNVWNIRKKEKLYYILPEDYTHEIECNVLRGTAVIVNLYYPDTLEKYFLYLDNIPKEISIYIVSSNPDVWDKISSYISKKSQSNIYLVKKDNRGRDISALLVTCREIVKGYKYICFIHDKKTSYEFLKSDTERWIDNLWGNSLKTENYIKNILALLEMKNDIGLLAPPEPVGEYKHEWYCNDGWKKNFANTVELAKLLRLNTNISQEFPPITLGTVFWGKVSALNKLFNRNWRYIDFPPEPLADDGTISHAIERILAYVAQDAGYKTGTIMTTAYAEEQMIYLQENLMNVFNVLKGKLGIINFSEFINFENKKKCISDFCEKNKEIYLYGAGQRGIDCLHLLRWLGYSPKGFIVTNEMEKKNIEGVLIKRWKDIHCIDNMGIIITVGYALQDQIMQILKERGFTNFINYVY